MSLPDAEVDDLVKDAARISDRGAVGLRAFADAFIEAHRRVPGGLSVEVGTRDGGSAILFLALLVHLYPAEHRPSLFTVDPYGSKLYDGVPIYTDINYLAMKKLLAPFPNHAHFLMTSGAFFDRLWNLPYWRPGQATVPVLAVETGVLSSSPVGEEHQAKDLAFALLDGEHDWGTISRELNALFGSGLWMHPHGLVAIDNIDADPETRKHLEADDWKGSPAVPLRADISENGEWAIVQRTHL